MTCCPIIILVVLNLFASLHQAMATHNILHGLTPNLQTDPVYDIVGGFFFVVLQACKHSNSSAKGIMNILLFLDQVGVWDLGAF